MTTTYTYQQETVRRNDRLNPKTIDGSSHQIGIVQAEPLIVMVDSLIRYAKAYRVRFESDLANDHILGVGWLDTLKSVKVLFDGDGAVANEHGITTDSKSNGALEGMFWDAMAIAGFKEADL